MLKLGSSIACIPGQLMFLERPDIEDMEEPVAQLIEIQRHVPWWIGDLLNYGLKIYGDDIYQVFPETCSLDMLNRYSAMAIEFPPDERFADLSYTHHLTVKPFKDKKVRRAFLQKASSERWNSEQLRDHIRKVTA